MGRFDYLKTGEYPFQTIGGEHPDVPGSRHLQTDMSYGVIYALPQVGGEEGAAPAFQVKEEDLSPDQKGAFDMIMAWAEKDHGPDDQVMRLGGYAGTGKTVLTGLIAANLDASRIAFCSFTGKASGVLRKSLRAAGVVPASCGTIHKLLYEPKSGSGGGVAEWRWRQPTGIDMIVVDEASMVGNDLWDDLLRADLPILAVGDHGQLPPIGKGSINVIEHPDVRLEQIHRQAEANPIIRISAAIREGRAGWRTLLNQDERAISLNTSDDLVPWLREHAERTGEGWSSELAVICGTNSRRTHLNATIRGLLGTARVGLGPQRGDPVICLKNTNFRGAPMYNGMRGVVVDQYGRHPHHYEVAVRFEDEQQLLHGWMSRWQFERDKTFSSWEAAGEAGHKPRDGKKFRNWREIGMLFDYAGAITCHKSQGASWNTVVVACERMPWMTRDEYKRWLYTAITRATDRITVVLNGS